MKFASGAPKTPQWISTCKARCTLTCDCWSLAGHTKNARLGYGPGQLQFTLLQAGLVELDDLRPAGRGITGGTCNKFMNQHHLVCEPAFGLVQKNNTRNFHLYGRLDPRSYTIHTVTSDFILIPSEEMPPPHAPTSFLPGKEEQPQNYREKTSHRPTTWTTPQEVSGLTIELLHREKIVKKKTCAGVSDKTKSCAVFSSIHIVHDSCAALLLFCPLVAAFVNFFCAMQTFMLDLCVAVVLTLVPSNYAAGSNRSTSSESSARMGLCQIVSLYVALII